MYKCFKNKSLYLFDTIRSILLPLIPTNQPRDAFHLRTRKIKDCHKGEAVVICKLALAANPR